RAAWISDLDGTQPVLRQSPPISPFSTSTVRAPSMAAPAATERPPAPAPITHISASIRVMPRFPSFMEDGKAGQGGEREERQQDLGPEDDAKVGIASGV